LLLLGLSEGDNKDIEEFAAEVVEPEEEQVEVGEEQEHEKEVGDLGQARTIQVGVVEGLLEKEATKYERQLGEKRRRLQGIEVWFMIRFVSLVN
jgi:hypothetical protein